MPPPASPLKEGFVRAAPDDRRKKPSLFAGFFPKFIDQTLDCADRRIVDEANRFAAARVLDDAFEAQCSLADVQLAIAHRACRLRPDVIKFVGHAAL